MERTARKFSDASLIIVKLARTLANNATLEIKWPFSKHVT